jgi:adenine-specific DNA-methyltransferase
MQRNTESNGRFHTDWLNMIYPRLKVARDLLSDDGVIFISIDDNEVENLQKICNEVFGDVNYLASLIWNKQHSQQQGVFKKYHETILVYAKSSFNIRNISGGSGIIEAGAQKKISKANPASEFNFPAGVRFDAPDGTVVEGTYGDAEKSTIIKGRLQALNGLTTEEVTISAGWTQKNQMTAFFKGEQVYDTKGQLVTSFYFNSAGKLKCTKERSKITPPSILPLYGMVSEQTTALDSLMEGHYFDMPKPVNMMIDFARWFSNESDIILDFFSGSATTAHAVMQLNAEDGGSRCFIMVQLPELTDEKSEAYKAGYKNICEIGKERIRRAGAQIMNSELGIKNKSLDTGFRVLKLDSSNMEDVYYTPKEFSMGSLFNENVKQDRTNEDLLFQVMLDLGIELSAKIESKQMAGKTVHFVDENYLIACFDSDVNETAITEIAKLQPIYFVMRDASAANDNVIDNFEQIFKHYSPNTNCRII